MSPEFKPLAQALLQERVDGKLTEPADICRIISSYPSVNFDEVSLFVRELIPCNIVPTARALAERYGLAIKL